MSSKEKLSQLVLVGHIFNLDMSRLPEKFPEYSIMYKTLLKKIKELEKDEKPDTEKIKQYKKELLKIEKKFPEGFFDRN